MKKLEFSINGVGLCDACQSETLFHEDLPDGWGDMTDDEKEEAVREIWYGNVQWSWCEVEK